MFLGDPHVLQRVPLLKAFVGLGQPQIKKSLLLFQE